MTSLTGQRVRSLKLEECRKDAVSHLSARVLLESERCVKLDLCNKLTTTVPERDDVCGF